MTAVINPSPVNTFLLTTQFTFISQIITTFIDAYVLTFDYKGDQKLIQGLVQIELFVQFIEVIFYVWLLSTFSKATNVTEKRYYDWVVTTPSMLFVFISYLDFINNNETIDEVNSESTYTYLSYMFNKHSHNLSIILSLNFLMLGMGFLGETKILDKYSALMGGFVPFSLYFYYIFDKYAKYTSTGIIMWSLFVCIWSFYGLASLQSYNVKNICYNILDIISKNFFGIYLAYVAFITTKSTI
jgi:hypothetical protein